MTMEFECSGCGSHFYVYGKEEEAFNARFDAILLLRSSGYMAERPNAWKIVQERAKCCNKPDISIVKWRC